ncbi:ATP phosphoribosyltransferase [Sandaracinus amylolyticus]|nr:ATP phosphoribosyltransferase [Sandaracinus amylolyticus]UJR81817.1 ATP phosphoribosyltransferase [Sandaracinus amylolyticus]
MPEKRPVLRAVSGRGVTIAVPKGRILKPLADLLEKVGVRRETLLADDRTLMREDREAGVSFLLLKPDDVPTYVEYGAADLGVVGRDVLLEREYDLYAPVDLGIGRCRMMVAGLPDRPPPPRTLRVATKFPNIAAAHYARRGIPVEIIFVQGSVELAPITGLADVIVDLVESGETLRQNGLVTFESICDVSSVVVANRAALKLKRDAIAPILAALEPARAQATDARTASPGARRASRSTG